MFMSAAEARKGFHAGQQDAEPEWQKVLARPANQQDAEDANGSAQGPLPLFYDNCDVTAMLRICRHGPNVDGAVQPLA